MSNRNFPQGRIAKRLADRMATMAKLALIGVMAGGMLSSCDQVVSGGSGSAPISSPPPNSAPSSTSSSVPSTTELGSTPDAAQSYEATALVTYTWQVEYSPNPDKPNQTRREKFATTSLLNRNGEKPIDAVTGPDDQGLWWPALPPRPTVDELEARKQSQDIVSAPELLKDVVYEVTFTAEGQTRTLPTNQSVYRQVVKALPSQRPMEFLIGGSGNWVQKATPK